MSALDYPRSLILRHRRMCRIMWCRKFGLARHGTVHMSDLARFGEHILAGSAVCGERQTLLAPKRMERKTRRSLAAFDTLQTSLGFIHRVPASIGSSSNARRSVACARALGPRSPEHRVSSSPASVWLLAKPHPTRTPTPAKHPSFIRTRLSNTHLFNGLSNLLHCQSCWLLSSRHSQCFRNSWRQCLFTSSSLQCLVSIAHVPYKIQAHAPISPADRGQHTRSPHTS